MAEFPVDPMMSKMFIASERSDTMLDRDHKIKKSKCMWKCQNVCGSIVGVV